MTGRKLLEISIQSVRSTNLKEKTHTKFVLFFERQTLVQIMHSSFARRRNPPKKRAIRSLGPIGRR